jgi:hypothetical protein
MRAGSEAKNVRGIDVGESQIAGSGRTAGVSFVRAVIAQAAGE